MSDPADDAAAGLLAEVHAARLLTRRPEAAEEAAASRLTTGELWAHARRAPGQPVSLTVERAVRGDPETALRYRAMLAGQALAHAPLAIAASDGAIARRRVGAFVLEIVPPEGDAPALLLIGGLADESRAPRLIEVALGPEAVRLDLGAPVAGAIALALDPDVAEAATLARLLADPGSEVFLL